MSKYAYIILGLCILSLIFLGVTLTTDSEQVTSEENQPVDLGIDYMNGTHAGYINSFKSESGRIYLSIDFLQAFITKKGSFIASIEEDFCPLSAIQEHIRTTYPEETSKKRLSEVLALQDVREAAVYFGKLTEPELEDFARYTGCFPNGINYMRNRSKVERERSIVPNLSANLEGEVITSENILDFLNKKKADTSTRIIYNITLKNGIVTNLAIAPK